MSTARPRISVITAVYNRVATIRDCIESVLQQDWPEVEYIIVDGNSSDGTDRIVAEYADRLGPSVREADRGIYDALNKGLGMATGDVVGFLHADDLFAHRSVLSGIAGAFADPAVQASYGDLVYVDAADPARVVRYWRSGPFRRSSFRWGWMPPHPTVYLRRAQYETSGKFRTDFSISADYEMMVRLLYRDRLQAAYLPDVLVRMRVGGKSNASLGNRLKANQEDRRAWQVNGFRPPFGLRFSKPLRKLGQFFRRPPHGPAGSGGTSGHPPR